MATKQVPVRVEYRTRVTDWMFFLGLLLLLMGLYGELRIMHVTSKGVPYPSAGVLPSNILFDRPNVGAFNHESDCNPYPQLYFENDLKTPRQPTMEESTQQEQLKMRCIDAFNEDRSKTLQYDRNQSAFLLFVGLGLIISRSLINRIWDF